MAVVDPQKQVRLRPVKIGRNYGQTVEVLEGVGTADQLVLNPPDSLSEGDQVAVAPQPAQKSAAAERPEPPASDDWRPVRCGCLGAALVAARTLDHPTPRPGWTCPPPGKSRRRGARARPDDTAPKGAWWQSFGDPELDHLAARR